MNRGLPWALGAALGLALGWLLFHGTPVPVDPTTAALRDSLTASRSSFDSAQAARKAQEAAQDARHARDLAILAQTKAAAGRAQQRADSAAAHHDTVTAYLLRTEEADSLRAALAQAEENAARSDSGKAVADSGWDAEKGRRLALERLNAGLSADLAKSRAPSRLTLGLTAGYGATLSGGLVRTGPTLAAGLTYSVRLPTLF